MEQFSRETERATEFCSYCPKMCRFSCPAARAEGRETVTPWGMMRLLEFVRDGSVAPSQDVAETFYHCMGCRRCREWCLHDNDVPSAMWEARAAMRREGFVPENLEGFCESFRANRGPCGELPDVGDLDGSGAAEIFDDDARVAYLPDCETRYDEPEKILRAGRLLERVLGEKVALADGSATEAIGCCGFPLLSAGDRQGYREHRDSLESALSDHDLLVAECPATAALYREESSWGKAGALEVLHVVEFLAERVDAADVPSPVDLGESMVHDSCFVSRQLGATEAVRRLLEILCETAPGEFSQRGEDAPCCGGPSHYPRIAPEASERLAEERLDEMDGGAEGVVCSAATCRDAFDRVASDVAEDLLDVAFRAFDLS